MNTRIRHLKVKIKTLAAEAGIIRGEERKLYTFDKALEDAGKPKRHYLERVDLAGHRRGTVRDAARANLLAYAYLRDVPYARVEAPNTVKEIDWRQVCKAVTTFGGDVAGVQDWYKGAVPTTAPILALAAG